MQRERTLNGQDSKGTKIALNLSPSDTWQTMLHQRQGGGSRETCLTDNWQIGVSLQDNREAHRGHAQGIRWGGPYVCGYEESYGQCSSVTNDSVKDRETGPITLLLGANFNSWGQCPGTS
jgi:hypothetical protein